MTSEFVNNTIASHKVVIFSKTTCPFCNMAKQAFDALKTKYIAVELNERRDGDSIMDVLNERTGSRTVPKVFLNGIFIGGGTDVKRLYDSGELSKLLLN